MDIRVENYCGTMAPRNALSQKNTVEDVGKAHSIHIARHTSGYAS